MATLVVQQMGGGRQAAPVLHAWETFTRALNRLAPPGVDNAFQTLPGAWTAYEGSRAVLRGLAVRPPCFFHTPPATPVHAHPASRATVRNGRLHASTASTRTIPARPMGALPQ